MFDYDLYEIIYPTRTTKDIDQEEEQFAIWETNWRNGIMSSDQFIALLESFHHDLFQRTVYENMKQAYKNNQVTQEVYIGWLCQNYTNPESDYNFDRWELPKEYNQVLYPFIDFNNEEF